MPTHDEDSRFWADYSRLTADQRAVFRSAITKFVQDLEEGRFRKGLRVKRVQGYPGVWERTWAEDGRATFEYGASLIPGEPHIIWRRVGSHDIFENP